MHQETGSSAYWVRLRHPGIYRSQVMDWLSHWSRVTHICVGKLTIIGSDNGLGPHRRQAIIGTNPGILLIRHVGTKFSEILTAIFTQENAFGSIVCQMAAVLSRPQCLIYLGHGCPGCLRRLDQVMNWCHQANDGYRQMASLDHNVLKTKYITGLLLTGTYYTSGLKTFFTLDLVH